MSILGFSKKITRPRKVMKLQYTDLLPHFIASGWKFVKYFLKGFLFYSFVFAPLFFSFTSVFSGSMTPTCETNDVVACTPISYGIRPSMWFNDMRRTSMGNIALCRYQKPKIGDIIVFQAKFDKKTPYTKRILAGPGDRIKFVDGRIFLNGEIIPIKYLGPYSFIENEKLHEGDLYEEYLPNGVKYKAFYSEGMGNGFLDNTEEYAIPEGHYFMVGDNRHGSDDSRSFIGAIPESHIIGKAVMILFSNGNMSTLNPVKWIQGMKWSRCFSWMI